MVMWSFIISILMTLIVYYRFYTLDNEIALEMFLWNVLSGINLTESLRFEPIDFLFVVIPILVFLYITSKFMLEDYLISSVYVFTRNSSKSKWYFRQCFNIMFFSIIFNIFRIVTVILIGYIYKMSVIEYKYFIELVIYLLLINVLGLFILSVLINIIALKKNIVMSYCSIYAFVIATMLIPILYDGKVRKIAVFGFPTNQMMLSYHDTNFINYLSMGSIIVEKFYISYSILYLFICSFMVLLIGYFIVRKLDILNFEV